MTLEQEALAKIAGNIVACETVKKEITSDKIQLCESLAYERIKKIITGLGITNELQTDNEMDGVNPYQE